MANTVFVRSAKKDRKIALSERNELHPTINHEAYVVGYPDMPDGSDDPKNIVEVGLTPLVRRLLADGTLIEVDAAEGKAAAEKEQQRQADLDKLGGLGQSEQQQRQAAAQREADQAAADRARKEAEEQARQQPGPPEEPPQGSDQPPRRRG